MANLAALYDDLLLERYKHVLAQMARIDENAHKFLTLYQGTTTAIVTGILALWLGHGKLGVAPELARSGVIAALLMVAGVGVVTMVLLVVGAFAWMDYRREEVALTAGVGSFTRSAGRWSNFWRWQETYMLALVAAVSLLVVVMGVAWVLPSLEG